ncbi:MAG: DNA-formamidopyrimidine glycosylase [Gemmatimonadetes bacterium]|uniref:DNA-formamidopyrimidine glycosylase n=1 Tax=Candidatus Kutchimonas denitrificans TaxID=3056748 RepID=A0AAE5CAN6_9BACT|nr:DNA-formamidopyrimidine glycosylase [Gemmatimonadota bacterium]NIR76711.1 DNA-formamidopyrimidine glycosylase [Candidatus Kutchimonas denitrificans]NIS01198.1 DNA-formamidopyrimidine glycosylase [Gemmatimonadota bacterium]NIT68237.1 DNA-formamidopyrimidine glycosylase [Gemmatimonadota bacterium]NIW75455.1 DNA-formamidopyrimidine glycosylase [Gemmatimonadota bacterium]
MPELPDVQVFKEYIDATALHQTIESVWLDGDDLLVDISAPTLTSRLKGHELESTRRHGKHLFVEISDDGWLRLHFGMTGEIRYYKDHEELPDHTRLRIDFDDDYSLAYQNTRKLGEIGLVEDPDEFIREEELGPDAMSSELDLRRFRELLEGRSGTIKGLLMNQNVIAGVGNVYADEILFRAWPAPRGAGGPA